ncbi:MAG: flagellar motor protein MotB [Ethanoligenens sp.]
MKRPPEKDNSERWLLPYSDLMNLLLILFIILYAMSKTDVQKATQVAESIRKGFNASQQATQQSPVSQKTTSTNDGASTSATSSSASAATQDWSALYDQVAKMVSQANLQNNVDLSSTSKGLVITLKDNTLYAPGSAVMNPAGQNLVLKIGDALKQVDYALIIVEGHTDSDAIHNAQFQDNIDLSSSRADNVERALITRGLDDKKIAAMGRADTVPIAPNDTAANKARNRRVVISIYKSLSNLTADQVLDVTQLESTAGK